MHTDRSCAWIPREKGNRALAVQHYEIITLCVPTSPSASGSFAFLSPIKRGPRSSWLAPMVREGSATSGIEWLLSLREGRSSG